MERQHVFVGSSDFDKNTMRLFTGFGCDFFAYNKQLNCAHLKYSSVLSKIQLVLVNEPLSHISD